MEGDNEVFRSTHKLDFSFLNSPDYMAELREKQEALKDLTDDILASAL
jgi:hypothetical protein